MTNTLPATGSGFNSFRRRQNHSPGKTLGYLPVTSDIFLAPLHIEESNLFERDSHFSKGAMRCRPQFQRRQFLCSIGAGALWAGLGPAFHAIWGVHTCHADQPTHRLTFGKRERLVSLIQETPIDRFLPAIVKEYRAGTSLEDLVAATALANTRCFGGEVYIGFHSLMALSPAYHLARQGNSIDSFPC